MTETMKVVFSPPAFSFLLYENIKSKFGQEGFLLGDIIEKQTKSITDNDQQQIHKVRTVKVNCCIPCPKTCYFYDSLGRLNLDKTRQILNNLTNKVIGWYIYKPMSSFNFTFREKLIHQQLTTLFDLPKEQFTCCLLISENANNSTYSYTQKFLHYTSNCLYEELPLYIINLSDPNRSYKSPEPVSEQFNQITNGLKINLKKTQGLTVITKIQSALEKHTQQIVEDLIEHEEHIAELEKEIEQIKTIKQPFVKLESLPDGNDKSLSLTDTIEHVNSENICNDNIQTRKRKKK